MAIWCAIIIVADTYFYAFWNIAFQNINLVSFVTIIIKYVNAEFDHLKTAQEIEFHLNQYKRKHLQIDWTDELGGYFELKN